MRKKIVTNKKKLKTKIATLSNTNGKKAIQRQFNWIPMK